MVTERIEEAPGALVSTGTGRRTSTAALEVQAIISSCVASPDEWKETEIVDRKARRDGVQLRCEALFHAAVDERLSNFRVLKGLAAIVERGGDERMRERVHPFTPVSSWAALVVQGSDVRWKWKHPRLTDDVESIGRELIESGMDLSNKVLKVGEAASTKIIESILAAGKMVLSMDNRVRVNRGADRSLRVEWLRYKDGKLRLTSKMGGAVSISRGSQCWYFDEATLEMGRVTDPHCATATALMANQIAIRSEEISVVASQLRNAGMQSLCNGIERLAVSNGSMLQPIPKLKVSSTLLPGHQYKQPSLTLSFDYALPDGKIVEGPLKRVSVRHGSQIVVMEKDVEVENEMVRIFEMLRGEQGADHAPTPQLLYPIAHGIDDRETALADFYGRQLRTAEALLCTTAAYESDSLRCLHLDRIKIRLGEMKLHMYELNITSMCEGEEIDIADHLNVMSRDAWQSCRPGMHIDGRWYYRLHDNQMMSIDAGVLEELKKALPGLGWSGRPVTETQVTKETMRYGIHEIEWWVIDRLSNTEGIELVGADGLLALAARMKNPVSPATGWKEVVGKHSNEMREAAFHWLRQLRTEGIGGVLNCGDPQDDRAVSMMHLVWAHYRQRANKQKMFKSAVMVLGEQHSDWWALQLRNMAPWLKVLQSKECIGLSKAEVKIAAAASDVLVIESMVMGELWMTLENGRFEITIWDHSFSKMKHGLEGNRNNKRSSRVSKMLKHKARQNVVLCVSALTDSFSDLFCAINVANHGIGRYMEWFIRGVTKGGERGVDGPVLALSAEQNERRNRTARFTRHLIWQPGLLDEKAHAQETV